MLSIAKTLKGYQLHGLDGEIGKVKEFYFDDRHWTVRYLVAETGNWLTGRQVLISPYALGAVIQGEQDITVELTKKQIEGSPSLDRTSPSPANSRRPTTSIMVGRCIGAAHTTGARILTSSATARIGIPPKVRKRGIPICAALTT